MKTLFDECFEPTVPTSDPTEKSSEWKTWALILGILGTVVLVIGAIIGLIYLCRKNKKSSGTTLHTSVNSSGFKNSLFLFVIYF